MSRRRMFSFEVVESDKFLDLPQSSQLLYVHLNMWADDDGFVSSPKRILKMVGASDIDMKLLITTEFVIPFESGILVITHFHQNNKIRKDRKVPTIYNRELDMLFLDENNVWNKNDLYCLPDETFG